MRSVRDFFLEEGIEAFSPCFPQAGVRAAPVIGLNGSALSVLVAQQWLRCPSPTLVVCPDARCADGVVEDLESLLDGQAVLPFPSHGLKPYERKRPYDSLLEERLRVLTRLWQGETLVVVTTLEALQQGLPSPSSLQERTLEFTVGASLDLEYLRLQLDDLGFREVPLVESAGEFSMRGCVVDVAPYLEDNPLRMELFGDEIESVRRFDAFSQRSLENLHSARIYPVGEADAGEYGEMWWMRPKGATHSLLDWMGNSTQVFLLEAESCPVRTQVLSELAESAYAGQDEEQQKHSSPPAHLYRNWEQLEKQIRLLPNLYLGRVMRQGCIEFSMREQTRSGSGLASAEQEILEIQEQGGLIYLVSPTPAQAARLRDLAGHLPIKEVLVGHLHTGFRLMECGVAFFTDHQLFNRFSRRTRRSQGLSAGQAALQVSALDRGDPVIHQDYGVGKFLGLMRMPTPGGHTDCVLLEYKGKDRLTFPVSDLHKIEKVAVENDAQIELHALGGKTWNTVKSRVKKQVIRIAQELVELYAKRKLVKAHGFEPDGPMQAEFEQAFEHEPTLDQVRAIAEVKADLEAMRPMDRLVCGDVGFGKTEVALRAAFKVVCERKQVAVLVPTTVLAAQHYETFRSRMAEWPVRVELYNRYRSGTEKKEVAKALATGTVDVVVGTHGLLSEGLEFRDLGLLIIDEEQKFGVKQKERLREIRLHVDTLSMSATPIPRTLHLSLTGVRDISLISTPPRNRLPVDTRVLEWDDAVLSEALRAELERGGQAFAVTDKIKGIQEYAEKVESWCPGARVAVAHGQMHEKDLEQVMSAFLNREFDVLVSTSIIESGLDVPNANTIFIHNAHNFGMSQLYQLRGRVGRSSVHAHAYLITPAGRSLAPEARRRMQAMERFTDLGSGYQLAMRDLEIRGAGNLLGMEQHGFITELGFETYLRMVREAVESLRAGGAGEQEPVSLQPRIELPLDAFLPEEYIEDGLQRITLYQRIARLDTPEGVEEMRRELRDRFGPLPTPAVLLLAVEEMGLWAACMGVTGVKGEGRLLVLTFAENPPPKPLRLALWQSRCPFAMRYVGSNPLQAVLEVGGKNGEELCLNGLSALRSMGVEDAGQNS